MSDGSDEESPKQKQASAAAGADEEGDSGNLEALVFGGDSTQ